MVHRIVWERENGRIPDGFQVHHKDGNKENNDIDNLELLSTLEHKRIHSGCYKDENGEWWKPCCKCGEYKRVENDYYRRSDGISPWCKSCCISTVKPIALMEYLIKMVTPKGGIVLDPFAGSGSTLVAAKQNGFQYIGIELTEEYIPIIEARLNALNQYKLL
jgi:hypothetical protein